MSAGAAATQWQRLRQRTSGAQRSRGGAQLHESHRKRSAVGCRHVKAHAVQPRCATRTRQPTPLPCHQTGLDVPHNLSPPQGCTHQYGHPPHPTPATTAHTLLAGAKLECGGGHISMGKGYLVEPTVFSGVKDDMAIARDE